MQTRELYAIKVFSLFDKDKRAQLLKEVETLWSMQCPSLISFVGGYLKVRSVWCMASFFRTVLLMTTLGIFAEYRLLLHVS